MPLIDRADFDATSGWLRIARLVFVARFESESLETDAFYKSTIGPTYLVGDPGAGNVQWDNADPSAATTVSIHHTDRNGGDRSGLLTALKEGDRITVSQSADRQFVAVVASNDLVEQATWVEVPVTVAYATASLIQSNRNVTVELVLYPADSIPAPGVSLEMKITAGDPWALYRLWYDETDRDYHARGVIAMSDVSFVEVK